MIRLRDVAFLTAGLLVGLFFAARVSASPPMVVPAPPGSGMAGMDGTNSRPQAYAPLVAPVANCSAPPVVTRVNDDTVISIKDEGDSQLVFVYTFDEHGTMKTVPQKSRFFYKF